MVWEDYDEQANGVFDTDEYFQHTLIEMTACNDSTDTDFDLFFLETNNVNLEYNIDDGSTLEIDLSYLMAYS